jgi:hypothetical protein
MRSSISPFFCNLVLRESSYTLDRTLAFLRLYLYHPLRRWLNKFPTFRHVCNPGGTPQRQVVLVMVRHYDPHSPKLR